MIKRIFKLVELDEFSTFLLHKLVEQQFVLI
jgi:hypothetical protein